MSDDEIFKVRERLHKLNDVVQVHEVLLKEHAIKIEMLTNQVNILSTKTATREQLDAAVLSLGEKVSTAVQMMSLEIKNIADDLAPIRKGVYWVITTVIGAIILAVLALIFRLPHTLP